MIPNIISKIIKIEEKEGQQVFKCNIEDTITYTKVVSDANDVKTAIQTCIKLVKNLPEYMSYTDELKEIAATI